MLSWEKVKMHRAKELEGALQVTGKQRGGCPVESSADLPGRGGGAGTMLVKTGGTEFG